MKNMNTLNNAFYKLGCEIRSATEALANLSKTVVSITSYIAEIYFVKHKRVKHLALYGKKARTRKKNYNRIKKGVLNNGRMASNNFKA